jgi:hypothetical protein
MPSDYKHGKCRWCEQEDEVFKDNDLCDDCDRNVAHCDVCDQDYHYHDPCRHIFQDAELQWQGSGIGAPDDSIKVSFRTLMQRMPRDFADDLLAAIRSGEFFTWLIAPMIGGGGIMELHGIPYIRGRHWGDCVLELGERSDAEGAEDGYHWLASLYKNDTREANKITMAWLAEFVADRDELDALARLADDGCCAERTRARA